MSGTPLIEQAGPMRTELLAYLAGGRARVDLRSERTGRVVHVRIEKDKLQGHNAVLWQYGVHAGDEGLKERRVGSIHLPAGEGGWLLGSWRWIPTYVAPDAAHLEAAVRVLVECVNAKIVPNGLGVVRAMRCSVCGRELTVPESIARGMGPKCAKQMGLLVWNESIHGPRPGHRARGEP